MKFLFMIFHDEAILDALPGKEMQTLVDSALDYDEEIRQSGHYIASNALERARSARTIRVRGGKATITDGPFAETKEQLGGFFLIEAKDMDEACEVAARFPPARIGTIEVRPVQELLVFALGSFVRDAQGRAIVTGGRPSHRTLSTSADLAGQPEILTPNVTPKRRRGVYEDMSDSQAHLAFGAACVCLLSRGPCHCHHQRRVRGGFRGLDPIQSTR